MPGAQCDNIITMTITCDITFDDWFVTYGTARTVRLQLEQGRIEVRGGPRLDTVMGPYPSFVSYHRLRTPSVWDIVPGKI